MKKNKPATNQNEHLIIEPLKDQLLLFIEHHPAKRFGRNLRRMLMDFLMFDGAIEARYLDDLLYDLDGFFELLEAIEEAESKGKLIIL